MENVGIHQYVPFVYDHFLNLLDTNTKGLDRRVKDGRRGGGV
jgi:hypothetical protein